MDIYLVPWIKVQYYHHLFCCSNCSSFNCLEHLQVGSRVLIFHHCFSISLLSPILVFSLLHPCWRRAWAAQVPCAWGAPISSYWRIVFRNQDLGPKCVLLLRCHCSVALSMDRARKKYIYIYIYIYIVGILQMNNLIILEGGGEKANLMFLTMFILGI